MGIRDFLDSRFGQYIYNILRRSANFSIAYNLSNTIADSLAGVHSSPLVQTIRLNQWVIRGERDLSPDEANTIVKAVLRHAGQCFVDLHRSLQNPQRIIDLITGNPQIQFLIEAGKKNNQGLFLAITHQSNFDLALFALGIRGVNAQVLTYGQPTVWYKAQNKVRFQSGVEITPVSEMALLKAMKRLKQGGLVITGIDRPVGYEKQTLTFFNHPALLPIGHIRMALAANVPIIVGTVQLQSDGLYHILISDPIPMRRYSDLAENIQRNGELVLRVVENYIRQAPEQWLMFQPVWPDLQHVRPSI